MPSWNLRIAVLFAVLSVLAPSSARGEALYSYTLTWAQERRMSVSESGCRLMGDGEESEFSNSEPLTESERAMLARAVEGLPLFVIGRPRLFARAPKLQNTTFLGERGLFVAVGEDWWKPGSPPYWLVSFAASRCRVDNAEQLSMISQFPRPLRRASVRWLGAASIMAWQRDFGSTGSHRRSVNTESLRCMRSGRCDRWAELVAQGLSDPPPPEPPLQPNSRRP